MFPLVRIPPAWRGSWTIATWSLQLQLQLVCQPARCGWTESDGNVMPLQSCFGLQSHFQRGSVDVGGERPQPAFGPRPGALSPLHHATPAWKVMGR